jgi:hypothetical protein
MTKQATETYKRTVKGSIGAGIGSVFGSGKSYYILEHKTSSGYHKAGESQEIIVNQIELGRDPKCQVQYDESFTTVSRRHAAIVRDGDNWKVINLSETNSTLVNGQRIEGERYLQNGDEIQLSSGGPKLGFIIPQGKQANIGSIGLSRRLSLFRHQALRPYKQAITALSIFLLLVVAGAIWWGTRTTEKLVATQVELSTTQDDLATTQEDLVATQEELSTTQEELNKEKEKLVDLILKNADDKNVVDSLSKALEEVKMRDERYKQSIGSLSARINNLNNELNNPKKTGSAEKGKPQETPLNTPETNYTEPSKSDLRSSNRYVFAVLLDKLVWQLPTGKEFTLSRDEIIGSGFILSDGRFVTARHVVEPWFYYPYLPNEDSRKYYRAVNYAAFNQGKVVAKYTIVSPTGKRYSFTNEQIICNRANDKIAKEPYEGDADAIVRTSPNDRYDWAYFQTDETSGLKFDNALSIRLLQSEQLDVLGFPRGFTEDINNLKPIYSTCVTARTGLDANGLILSSNDNIAPGNSGSPVFARRDGELIVVGVVSGQNYSKGAVIPISEVK